jgi:hypothetical protein
MSGGRSTMTDEEDSDLELFGTRPGVIAFFMIFISLMVPIGIIPGYAFVFFGGHIELVVYGLIWVWSPSLYAGEMYFILLHFIYTFWMTLPLTLFNYLYIAQIIRYYRGKCERYSAVWVGLLSITLPTLFALTTTGSYVPGSAFIFIGPIPLQFLAGLYFMRRYPGPEMTSPWEGNLDDRSWWKPKRPNWWFRMFPSKKEDNEYVEKEELNSEADWLESE